MFSQDTIQQRLEKIQDNFALTELAQEFPQHNHQIATYLIEHFNKLVSDYFDILAMMGFYPNHEDEIFQQITIPENFKKITEAKYIFSLQTLNSAFPKHNGALFQLVKQSENMEKIDSLIDVITLMEIFTERPEFFQSFFTPDNFRRWVKTSEQIEILCDRFPDQNSALLNMLCNSENFKFIVQNSKGLSRLAQSFPGHDSIFRQPTIEKAAEAAANLARAFTEGATIGALQSSESLKELVIPDISAHMSQFFSSTDSARLARVNRLALMQANEMKTNAQEILQPVITGNSK